MEATQALLTKRETANLLNMSLRTVDNLLARKQLTFVKIGSSVRFTLADVQAFIAAQRKGGA